MKNSKKILTINNHKICYYPCISIFKKLKGLMFSKPKNLLFISNKPIKVSFHMFFVFYPIDLILINKNKIVEIKKNFKPFSYYMPKNKFQYALELPNNHLKFNIGDKVGILGFEPRSAGLFLEAKASTDQ